MYYAYNTHIHYTAYTGDMAWHVYLTLVLPGCHFVTIFASKVSRKNKGKVSKFFGQSVTNDTSTPRLSTTAIDIVCANAVVFMCSKLFIRGVRSMGGLPLSPQRPGPTQIFLELYS